MSGMPALLEHDLEVVHDGEPRIIHCDIERPVGASSGTLLIAHGFLGYKDYGMFPYLARRANAVGWTTIRFNFSHSGMTRRIETFERPELFELDTWDRQDLDLKCLLASIRCGEMPEVDPTGSVFLLGHSRGGVASILSAGRGTPFDGVIAVAAGSESIPHVLDEAEARRRMHEEGGITVTSSRTGQDLRMGSDFLATIEANPAAHDIPAMAARLEGRLAIIHGDDDPTVDVRHAHVIGEAAGVTPLLIPGANHVFNVANPFSIDDEPSPQLDALAEAVCSFLSTRATG
jgi:pimeloyl-ACP methyl ester carboxylesterase